jgi:hypothetical protein
MNIRTVFTLSLLTLLPVAGQAHEDDLLKDWERGFVKGFLTGGGFPASGFPIGGNILTGGDISTPYSVAVAEPLSQAYSDGYDRGYRVGRGTIPYVLDNEHGHTAAVGQIGSTPSMGQGWMEIAPAGGGTMNLPRRQFDLPSADPFAATSGGGTIGEVAR